MDEVEHVVLGAGAVGMAVAEARARRGESAARTLMPVSRPVCVSPAIARNHGSATLGKG
jgi:hypothetical protein